MITGFDWTSRTAQIAAPARRGDVTQESLDGEAILYDPTNGHTFRLNETALAVWHGCDGRSTIQAMAEAMSDRYEVDVDTALDHTEQLVAFFATSGLFDTEA